MKKIFIPILIIIALGIGVAIDRMTIWFSEPMFYSKKEYNLPNSVIEEEYSPNGLFVAKIVKEDKSESYFFSIQKKGGVMMIINSEIAPPHGYHHPVFNLSWDKNSEVVFITVNHDFGEGNLKYVFSCKEFSLNTINN